MNGTEQVLTGQAGFSPHAYSPDVLTCVASLSNVEVFVLLGQ